MSLDNRIRNSLQLVAGLLQTQARRSGHAEAAAELLAASHRVMSIARVHELLYRDPGGGLVDLRPYLEDLCRELGRGVGTAGCIRLAADELRVPADHAIDFGIIATELILNALKHAYGGEVDTVDVTARLREDRLILTVSDHGPVYLRVT